MQLLMDIAALKAVFCSFSSDWLMPWLKGTVYTVSSGTLW